ncbi:hypothetical protein PDESU_06310 [Pontiella desulfatans]|uniref:Uncharacterized protein n=1 Tax=Pontiella desulfatans TaxID=2750659 RepID=A0A6C2UC09_PONDE|nr:hypothetical protein [Pontiella desulfatans]VGO17708.1 hypothetical protein PDESU_06310 [Pontiella desulfatans]
MLTLNISHSKKVPADVDFSSKSYSVALSVELPNNMSAQELKAEMHRRYAELEIAVDEQITGKVTRRTQERRPQSKKDSASEKQLVYLMDLAKARNVSPQQLDALIQQRVGVESALMLDRKSCSLMIDQMQQYKAA